MKSTDRFLKANRRAMLTASGAADADSSLSNGEG